MYVPDKDDMERLAKVLEELTAEEMEYEKHGPDAIWIIPIWGDAPSGGATKANA